MTTSFFGWRGCCISAMKTTLLRISFLQSIVCWKCSTGTNFRNYIILFGEWEQVKEELHCLQFCLQLNMLNCSSQAEYLSFLLCGKIHLQLGIYIYIDLKSGKTLFQCFHVIVLQYYIPMKEVNHFLNNITLIHPNSSTKATLLWREGNLGVLGCGVTRW